MSKEFNERVFDVNDYWKQVRATYPDARFVKWFKNGELHFYPNGDCEKRKKDLGSCYKNDRGRYDIGIGDMWK